MTVANIPIVSALARSMPISLATAPQRPCSCSSTAPPRSAATGRRQQSPPYRFRLPAPRRFAARHRHRDRHRARPLPRHRRVFGHQIIGTAIGTIVCIVGAWAVPALAHLTDRGVDQFVQATEHSNSSGASNEPSSATVAPAVVAAEIPAETAEQGEHAEQTASRHRHRSLTMLPLNSNYCRPSASRAP